MNNLFIAQTFGRSSNYTDIQGNLFKIHDVKKGLRNEDGTGVIVGLTRVSDVVGYDYEDGKKINIPGKLYYRGIEISDLVNGKENDRYGYEETAFLLLFGYLPSDKELKEFTTVIQKHYPLPNEFFERNMLRSPSFNLMNSLQKSILALYDYDNDSDNTDPYQILLKGINILAKLPTLAVYAYQSKIHHYDRESLVIHYPRPEYSMAENILHLLRPGGSFTQQEANLLDVMLMIHADHGGGNNSTFTNVVISSTGTDIYSAISGSIGSLKGPKHGGANIRCSEMIAAIEHEIGLDATEDKMRNVIERILSKNFYDNSGLVYGLGHAVYTISDPRADLLKNCCEKLAKEKKRLEEYEFLAKFESVAKAYMAEKGKPLSNNVDFYSGFAYNMLRIPEDMYTPLFVCARMAGWLAHNIENKMYDGRIMRPATKYVGETNPYIKREER
ncbi:citrate synthase [Lacrimispora algidixylanolytica]|uniref:Citrate synthase n=1 Tax=Lacrimispora algidixylanolytica TaxID=94868 RepID=A0A419SSH6_9FIRM|nr:citrate synthase [Lacrimispora algidixylanolytica]RKD28201.1 citrate synthase [Lacrimispora algidixylanolytica]